MKKILIKLNNVTLGHVQKQSVLIEHIHKIGKHSNIVAAKRIYSMLS